MTWRKQITQLVRLAKAGANSLRVKQKAASQEALKLSQHSRSHRTHSTETTEFRHSSGNRCNLSHGHRHSLSLSSYIRNSRKSQPRR